MKQQILTIHALRTGLFVTVLLVSVAFQVSHDSFINTDVWIPVYLCLICQFFINSIYLFNFAWFGKFSFSDSLVFGFDALIITSLIYFTGTNQSVFIFLYLITIIFTGLIYQRRGALLMALWTSSLLSILLIATPQIHGQSLYFTVGINNIAFFSVAWLSGLLSEQMNFIGSELKAKTKDLEALKDLNQLIVENIGTGLMTVDLNLRIMSANRGAAMILDDLGLTEKGLPQIFKNVSDRLIRGDLKKSRGHRMDEEFLNYKNEKLHLSVIVSCLVSPEKELSGYVLLFQDVTHMRRLEFQMRQQEKMAAVGQLAAGIAHEIRNPLASISGSIQLMSDSLHGLSEENQKLMRIILKEIDRLNDLISEFLDFVRPDTKTEDPVDIHRLIYEVYEMIRYNKTVRNDIAQKLNLRATGVVLGHFDKLKQALLNIVINSYQAMEFTVDPVITIETRDTEDGHVVVTVQDNGEGIDEQHLRRIFEPFHTTKPKGTGLGLAITHKILENHEGRIYVESERGQGTIFTIELPAHLGHGDVGPELRKRA